MNFLNIFEDRVASIFGASRAPFSFKKLAKQTAREMESQTLVVNGTNTAPALYTILISAADDSFMVPFYPQLAREAGEFIKSQAEKKRYALVGEPLVRFMIDPALKPGKFSVFAENVDGPTLARLYEEERAYHAGVSQNFGNNAALDRSRQAPMPCPQTPQPAMAAASAQYGVAAGGAAQGGAVGYPAAQPISLASDAATAGAAAGGATAGDAISPDPFASVPDAEPVPVPKTITRDAIAGVGGAAATGAALGAAASAAGIATNLAGTRPPSPAQATAQLVDVVTGDVYQVTGPTCVVGRERAATDVALRDPNVSRRHAQLISTGTDWSIEDLNSTNGTLVNNRRITRCPLRNGDMLTFGLSTFEFRS